MKLTTFCRRVVLHGVAITELCSCDQPLCIEAGKFYLQFIWRDKLVRFRTLPSILKEPRIIGTGKPLLKFHGYSLGLALGARIAIPMLFPVIQ